MNNLFFILTLLMMSVSAHSATCELEPFAIKSNSRRAIKGYAHSHVKERGSKFYDLAAEKEAETSQECYEMAVDRASEIEAKNLLDLESPWQVAVEWNFKKDILNKESGEVTSDFSVENYTTGEIGGMPKHGPTRD